MNKNIFYLLGFIAVMVVNYLLKGTYDSGEIEQLNKIHTMAIIDNALGPIALFLLLKFFSTGSWKFKTFAVVYGIIMLLELSLGYFHGSGHFDYNYLIGCLIGLFVGYGLELLIPNVREEKHQEKAI